MYVCMNVIRAYMDLPVVWCQIALACMYIHMYVCMYLCMYVIHAYIDLPVVWRQIALAYIKLF